jgi:TonB family protein
MDSERKSLLVLLGVLLLSAGLHVAAWGGLGLLPPIAALIDRIETTEVEIVQELLPPEPVQEPPPEPEPEPEPVVEPEPEVVPRERPPPREDAPPPPPVEAEPPAPVEEQIADFTGETLTVEGPGATWTSAVGNGEDSTGPIGGPTGQLTGRRRSGGQEGVVGGTGQGAVEQVVNVRDLREMPTPPDDSRMRAALERRYPTRLRGLSIEGRAVVRARIRANGELGAIRVRSATESEFGQACIEALREVGGWRAGVGADGQPAATDVNFNCEFALTF